MRRALGEAEGNLGEVIYMATRRPRTKSQAAVIFGERLRKARELKGFEYAKEFAGLIGKKEGAYNKYERGESEPDFETLLRICHVLGTTPTFLLLGPIEEQSNLAAYPEGKRPRRD